MTYKSKKELALAYKVSPTKLRNMIDQVPQIKAKRTARLLSPEEQYQLYKKFGDPFRGKTV